MTWVRFGFFAAAGLQIAALFLDRRLVPYCGTFAMAGLLAMALTSPNPAGTRRWTRHAAVGGLALLTLTAFLSDIYAAGYGWPVAFAGGDGGAAMLEPMVVAVGGAALAAAVLGRAGPLIRWRHVPAGLFALVLLVWIGDEALQPSVSDWEVPADVRVRFMVLIPIGLVIAALGLAINAGLVSRGGLRSAAAGLGVVTALALSGLSAVESNELLAPRFDEAAKRASEISIHGPRATLESLVYIDSFTSAQADEFYAADINSWEVKPDNRYLYSADVRRPAPEPEPDTGIEAVAGPPSGITNPWEGGVDWTRSQPALEATLILTGLVALVTALFRIDPDHPADGISRSHLGDLV
ncbi:hypothetical protein EDD30_5370 [Couchioplanes caeruleus]|uniref:Uncharacterized protein n=1 Tax=Couchioplanes caeruleus TaxID=56438 RepID=A0A3N1GQC5_9ACTN|nr:hypothetical protein EDD30_5370 [Couchioplanes caeruleus]